MLVLGNVADFSAEEHPRIDKMDHLVAMELALKDRDIHSITTGGCAGVMNI